MSAAEQRFVDWLAARLAAPQLVRLTQALEAAGPDGEATLRLFLEAMINAEDRPKVSAIIDPAGLPADRNDEGKPS